MKNSIEGPIASPLFFKYLVDESKSIQHGDKRNILKKCFFLMKPANSIHVHYIYRRMGAVLLTPSPHKQVLKPNL
jgi:hypothetical protein